MTWFIYALAVVSGVTVSAAELRLEINPRWKNQSLAVPSGALTNDAGQSLRVTRLAGLISEVVLRRADGGAVTLPGQFGYFDAESGRTTLALRGVPDGDYAILEFNVGVPDAINHADPAQWPAKHVLNPLVNGLHWNWQGGYVFLAVEGRWGEPANERGFLYHVAGDARLMHVGFRADFQVRGDTTIDVALDVSRILAPHQLAANDGSDSTHSAAGDERAERIKAAASRAWFWLGTRPTPVAGDGDSVSQTAPRTKGTTPFAFVVPASFPQPELPADNPLTVEAVELGRRLFSDVRLSGNGTQSCASCHDPERAFSDRVAFSRGAAGATGTRNAMPLVNIAWSPAFAWDGSQPRIRDQARAAWTNPIEMNAEPARVLARLAQDPNLAAQFAGAFGTSDVTPERVTLALEQYLLTQVSADSRFDRSLRGTAELTEEEKRGFELFAMEFDPAHGRRGADCFHCHGGPLFTDFAEKNTGLDAEPKDPGRMHVTGRTFDSAKFKTPSLRNVAVTGPYMHDGRFKTLEDVIAHYDHGVARVAGLDPNLAKHPDAGLELSAADQRALVAFLRTLTDAKYAAAEGKQ